MFHYWPFFTFDMFYFLRFLGKDRGLVKENCFTYFEESKLSKRIKLYFQQYFKKNLTSNLIFLKKFRPVHFGVVSLLLGKFFIQ